VGGIATKTLSRSWPKVTFTGSWPVHFAWIYSVIITNSRIQISKSSLGTLLAVQLLKILTGLLRNSRASLPCTQNLVTTANPEYLVSTIRTAVMIRAIESTQSPPPDQQVNSRSRHQLISKWIHWVATKWSASEFTRSPPSYQQVNLLSWHQLISKRIHSITTKWSTCQFTQSLPMINRWMHLVATNWTAGVHSQLPSSDQQVNSFIRHQTISRWMHSVVTNLIGKCMLSVAIKWSASDYTQSPPND
jgi:hypothetical protein